MAAINPKLLNPAAQNSGYRSLKFESQPSLSTMEIDPHDSDSEMLRKKVESIQALTTGSFSSSVSKLAGSSRGLPSDKDFHFYYLFNEFKVPIDEILATSQGMLEKIGSANQFLSSETTYPQDDVDDGYNWLVNVNDELLERFDASVEEFSRIRSAQSEARAADRNVVDGDGFQLVSSKRKKSAGGGLASDADDKGENTALFATVKVSEKDKKVSGAKPKVPFHIPSVKRPQDVYNILVNNSNQPFEHVWLERSDDDSKIVHPLEKLSVSDFFDFNPVEPMKPPPMKDTPFKLVQSVDDLKEMVGKLKNVDEFAVDLEHNQYRSFQGLTCLMQISTRTEDFVVDTLQLRVHVGPYLRELFKNPAKKKVMHGADRDVLWLQRDFGIYICNLFDTGQASRVLKMERNSLEFLLQHFCTVTANKQYQNADWRLRPLPVEMVKYAREDTHYLLYIHDLMRVQLLSEPNLLAEVYQRSYDVCMQLYEKELLTDTSYQRIYGLQCADFDAKQLAVASGLFEWRDTVARAEDESTGYILPNKALVEIAKQIPYTTNKLRRLVKYKHPYVEQNLSAVVNIIRHSVEHSAEFEAVVVQLREAQAQARAEAAAAQESSAGRSKSEVPLASDVLEYCASPNRVRSEDGNTGDKSSGIPSAHTGPAADSCKDLSLDHCTSDNDLIVSAKMDVTVEEKRCETDKTVLQSDKSTGVTIQVLKKPSRAFGALLGGSSTRKRVDPSKLEQIKSSVNLPFHSFSGATDTKKEESAKEEAIQTSVPPLVPDNQELTNENVEDVIPLEGDLSSDGEAILPRNPEGVEGRPDMKHDPLASSVVDCMDSTSMSLSDLSSSFQKCIDSMSQTKPVAAKVLPGLAQFKPFDYEAAREETMLKESGKNEGAGVAGVEQTKVFSGKKARGGGRASLGRASTMEDDETSLPQGRRRQAFPASGNRSSTFR